MNFFHIIFQFFITSEIHQNSQINQNQMNFQVKLLQDLNSHDITYQSFDINHLKAVQKSRPVEKCPIFIKPHHKRRRKRATESDSDDHDLHLSDEDITYIPRDESKLFYREPLIPIHKYYPTYVIWTSNISEV